MVGAQKYDIFSINENKTQMEHKLKLFKGNMHHENDRNRSNYYKK